MSDTNEHNAKARPVLLAYQVSEGKDGKSYWNNVGVATQHKDGRGYDLDLKSFPVNGKVTMRELMDERIKSREQASAEMGKVNAKERDFSQQEKSHEPTR